MAKNEKTSRRVLRIAARAMKAPIRSLSAKEIRSMAASLLTQAPDRSRK